MHGVVKRRQRNDPGRAAGGVVEWHVFDNWRESACVQSYLEPWVSLLSWVLMLSMRRKLHQW